MKQQLLTVSINQKSQVFVGKKLGSQIKKFIAGQPVSGIFYVTDSNLAPLLKKYLNPPKQQVFVMRAGESQKTFGTLTRLIGFMIKNGGGKTSLVVGFGGGVVTDTAGFAAAVFNRGVSCVQIPTSLVGMVDAAIGGKNGVDFEHYKNLIGTIVQPQAVFVDTGFLDSLLPADIQSGLGEVLRTALVFDSKLFSLLNRGNSRSNLETAVEICVKNKLKIVKADPLEQSNRRWLMNFGHTLGHALESYSKFKLKHGTAVAIGCHFASFVSLKKDYIKRSDYERIVNLMKRLDLPLNYDFKQEQVMQLIKKDKKKIDNKTMNFVLIKGIGEGYIQPMSYTEIRKYLIQFQNQI